MAIYRWPVALVLTVLSVGCARTAVAPVAPGAPGTQAAPARQLLSFDPTLISRSAMPAMISLEEGPKVLLRFQSGQIVDNDRPSFGLQSTHDGHSGSTASSTGHHHHGGFGGSSFGASDFWYYPWAGSYGYGGYGYGGYGYGGLGYGGYGYPYASAYYPYMYTGGAYYPYYQVGGSLLTQPYLTPGAGGFTPSSWSTGFGFGMPGTTTSAATTVTLTPAGFVPATTTVVHGGSLQFNNQEGSNDAIVPDQQGTTAASLWTGEVNSGAASQPIQLAQPGTYTFHSLLNPALRGQVVVQ